jgi:1-acyl-sn-glycerol-3-phosphate acyltransferase
VVANHCSYLDGVVLAAVLPPRFDFVIKREMNSVPLAGFLLQRIGVQFVTRDNRAGSLRDALRVMRSAAGGSSLAFFPEGTFLESGRCAFTRVPCRRGTSGAPIVPLVIRGTRHCLAPGGFLPRPPDCDRGVRTAALVPGRLDDAAALRDAARAAILEALGEAENAGANECVGASGTMNYTCYRRAARRPAARCVCANCIRNDPCVRRPPARAHSMSGAVLDPGTRCLVPD